MKKIKVKASIFTLLLSALGGLSVYAQGTHVGGGDPCRNEIIKHRQTITDWIESGDAADLDFSKAQVKGLDFDIYRNQMLTVLAPGKVVVTCYFDPGRMADPEAQKLAREKGVAFKAITLGDQSLPTACINYEDDSGVSHIDCNYDAITNQQSLEDPNYILTHHEYASIAGIELRKTNSEPDFSISNQLAYFEKWVKVKLLGKRLVVRPKSSNTTDSLTVNSYLSFNSLLQGAGISNIYQKSMEYRVFSQALQKWPYQASDRARLQNITRNQADLEFDRNMTKMTSRWHAFSSMNHMESTDLKIAWKGRSVGVSEFCGEGAESVSCQLIQQDRLELTSQNLALLVKFNSEDFRENAFWQVPLIKNRAKVKSECHSRFDELSRDPSVMAIAMDDRLVNHYGQEQRSSCIVNYISLELR